MKFPSKNPIPAQLRNTDFRFIKVEKGGKRPIEKDWTHKNYSFCDHRLLDWIAEGGNYGVLGGYGNLAIIDFDDEEAMKKVLSDFPLTFTAKSGGRGMPHVYVVLEKEIPKYPIKNAEKKTLVDVQAMGAQVVGPGSRLSSGGVYGIVHDVAIKTITVQELQAYLKPLGVDVNAPELKPKTMHFPKLAPQEGVVGEIKRNVRISSVLSTLGCDVRCRPTMCPLGHPSSGGKCFSFDDGKGLGHCFNCGWGGDVIKLVMDAKHLDFKEAIQWLKNEFNL